MHFWNQYALGEKLAKGKLSEWEKAKYYIAFAILHVIGGFRGYISFQGYEQQRIEALLKLIYAVIVVIIVFRGIKSAFEVNKKIDNLHFIERITCLSFPLTIKFSVVFFGLMFFIGIVWMFIQYPGGNEKFILSMLISILYLFLIYMFYVFLRKSFEKFADFVNRINK